MSSTEATNMFNEQFSDQPQPQMYHGSEQIPIPQAVSFNPAYPSYYWPQNVMGYPPYPATQPLQASTTTTDDLKLTLRVINLRLDGIERAIAIANARTEQVQDSMSSLSRRQDPVSEIQRLRGTLLELTTGLVDSLIGEETLPKSEVSDL